MNRDEYYAGLSYTKDYIKHHGIEGQKWGVRLYQNPDGSLTEAGKQRYARRAAEFEATAEAYRRQRDTFSNQLDSTSKFAKPGFAGMGIALGTMAGAARGSLTGNIGLKSIIGMVLGGAAGYGLGAGWASAFKKVNLSTIDKSIKDNEKKYEEIMDAYGDQIVDEFIDLNRNQLNVKLSDKA